MTIDTAALSSPSCPAPVDGDRVTLVHGAGTGASARLFEQLLLPRLRSAALEERHDGAVLALPGGDRLAFTTDTYVVSPLEFPGGDIGSLAVHGTVNDLAMCGARPLALSCALVLEEGLPLSTLERVIDSVAAAARAVGVPIVTGDTKVVERGKGDGLFVNTAGVGLVPAGRDVRPARVCTGDRIVVSGSLASHGVAVLSQREGLAFESEIVSDSAPLSSLVEAMCAAAPDLHCLRDPTRGGLGAVLHEIAAAAGVEIEVDEASLPFEPAVNAACELLGLDPIFLASEGRCVAFVPAALEPALLAAMRAHPDGAAAVTIGEVVAPPAGRRATPGRVVVRTRIGGRRLLERPLGEPLPRIC
jgi:hydrogenase expression/formation protein HypE